MVKIAQNYSGIIARWKQSSVKLQLSDFPSIMKMSQTKMLKSNAEWYAITKFMWLALINF